MFTLNTRIVTALSMFVAAIFILPVTAVQAQSGPVDVAAVEILQKTTPTFGDVRTPQQWTDTATGEMKAAQFEVYKLDECLFMSS